MMNRAWSRCFERVAVSGLAVLAACWTAGPGAAAQAGPARRGAPVCISGIYPHLAVFNGRYNAADGTWTGTGKECGIGAVVPWAGKLWMITYPPHDTRGGRDKLWTVDADLVQEIRPESVGGTHAGRMIHRESNQLIIGPYFVDAGGKVRAANVRTRLIGRMTAVARHLTDPKNLVYFFDMEGAIYEVNVHTLAVKKLFAKPVPGDHGKGGYTGQGRLIIANNGERRPKAGGQNGVLAEWDGKEWRTIERKQFCDVTGPGGINGAPDRTSPVWATGWDRRSVILKLLDAGKWHTFRMPKASHTFDPVHGWYTEWPRIREVGAGKMLMVMHGMIYDFPRGFSAKATGPLAPLASHLRYIPDFCDWNGRLVLASDDASVMGNPMVTRAQSNLWFGKVGDLPSFGPRSGWGGVWMGDAVAAGEVSEPFLIKGFARRVLHLATVRGRGPAATGAPATTAPATFTLEIDRKGDGVWSEYKSVTVGASGYAFHIFRADFDAAWIRVRAHSACRATAYFHYASPRPPVAGEEALFAALPKAGDSSPWCGGLVRPAGHNTNLQFVPVTVDADGTAGRGGYLEVDKTMTFAAPQTSRADEVKKIAAVKQDFTVDGASVIMTAGSKRYRLPKGHAAYDRPFAPGRPRGIRECVSERYLANIHGTFYELPRSTGMPDVGLEFIKPVASHGRKVMDFCTWRGLMVISGTLRGARGDGNFFASADGKAGLWFGSIDDLWRLGKPVGVGGPWRDTPVKARAPSDPYLMTGYDRKRLELSHDADSEVAFTIEVNFDHNGFHVYKTIAVGPGKTVTHGFGDGFGAHWARVSADKPCKATAWFVYE